MDGFSRTEKTQTATGDTISTLVWEFISCKLCCSGEKREDVVGWGNCCSSVPFPSWEPKRSFDHRNPYNKIAGNYLKMLSHYRPEWLSHYRPECDLPSVQQSNRVPYIMAGKLFPRRPTRTLFKKDGIHPALNTFDQLLRDSLDEWIARCKRFQ